MKKLYLIFLILLLTSCAVQTDAANKINDRRVVEVMRSAETVDRQWVMLFRVCEVENGVVIPELCGWFNKDGSAARMEGGYRIIPLFREKYGVRLT